MATLRRRNLPEAVIFTRFDMALCVLSFCFIFLSFFVARGKHHANSFNQPRSCKFPHNHTQYRCVRADISVADRGAIETTSISFAVLSKAKSGLFQEHTPLACRV